MSKIKDGGPAFGQVVELRCVRVDVTGAEEWEPALSQGGMSLRDYFAAKAMQGMVSAEYMGSFRPDSWASEAYAMADAMLKEREGA